MTESPFLDACGQITAWLTKQPRWFSYALHIAAQEAFTQQDIDNLAATACSENGFSIPFGNPDELAEFQEADLASFGTSDREIILESITAERNVNALAEGASLTFAQSGLTIVYGNNGSGKSGFCRLLRNAGTSRIGSSDILPNAFEQGESPKATYEARVDGEHQAYTWVEGENDYPQFPEVMYFDAACAIEEIQGKKNDVLYVPPILALLDRLSIIVGEVSNRLQRHSEQLLPTLQPTAVPSAFRQVQLISDLIKSDNPAEARIWLVENELSANDLTRMKELPKLIESDPNSEIPKLQARITQLNQLRTSLVGVYKVCDQKFEATRVKAVDELKLAREAAETVRSELASSSSLDGVGNDVWKALWQAAREYSEAYAYPESDFPVVDQDAAVCPLCQQPLSEEAKVRMSAFEKYMKGAVQKNLVEKDAALKTVESSFAQAMINASNASPSVPIIGDGETRTEVANLLDKLSGITGIPDMQTRLNIQSETKNAGTKVREEIDALNNQMEALKKQAKPGAIETYRRELLTLQAKSWISDNRSTLISDVKTRHMKKQIEAVRKGCSSLPISRLVSTISQTEVVERLKNHFLNELEMLKASSQRVYLKARTQAGKEYQELSLDGAAGKTPSSQVLSEGEQKIAAIAGFFALLDVSPNRSTVVFDDPVTSLDHNWRGATANRIVEEAKKRPVIVFTHDPRFCCFLGEHAEEHAVPIEYRTVARRGRNAGIVHDELTWGASSTSQRIKHLNSVADTIQKRLKNDEFEDNGEYEELMSKCYSKLRAAWERAVEEVLLAKTIERSVPPVHTQPLRYLTDIKQEDIDTVKRNMDKCSTITEAHDDPLEAPDAVPSVNEFKSDIAELKSWTTDIRKRREGL